MVDAIWGYTQFLLDDETKKLLVNIIARVKMTAMNWEREDTPHRYILNPIPKTTPTSVKVKVLNHLQVELGYKYIEKYGFGDIIKW